MSWAAQAGVPPYSIPNDMSAGDLAVMAIVIVICLGFLLIPVMLAGRPPRHPRPNRPAADGPPVLGGMHRGGGRSVAPHRDEPAEAEVTGGIRPTGPSVSSGRAGADQVPPGSDGRER
jgi:hypothetical protein